MNRYKEIFEETDMSSIIGSDDPYNDYIRAKIYSGERISQQQIFNDLHQIVRDQQKTIYELRQQLKRVSIDVENEQRIIL